MRNIVKVTSEQRPPREAVLSVELEPEDLEPYLDRAYKQVVGRLNIHGFRKGKAPRRIVEQMYGREYLTNEALDFLLPEVTTKALEQESLEMGGFPSISLDQLDPLKYTATVPLTPTVDLGAFKRVRVPRERVRIGKSQIDEVLARISNEAAPWEPVEGAPQFDDLLNMTVRGWTYHEEHAHDHELINSEQTDYVPRQNSRAPVPGFAEKIITLPLGAETEFAIDVPADFENAEIAGASAQFVATVHSVKRRVPMAVDDELAKGVGDGYGSLAELREKVKTDLETQEEANATERHRNEAVAKVVEGATVEVSPILINHELDHYLEDFREAMQTGRMTLEHYQRYLTWAGKSEEEIRDDARPEAEERVKRSLIMRELIAAHDIEISDKDVEAEIAKMVGDAGSEGKQISDMFKEQGAKDSLRRVLAERGTIDVIADIAATGGAAVTEAKGGDKSSGKAPKPAAKGRGGSRAKATRPKAGE